MRPIINRVAVVGAGQMGTRIAQIFCEAGMKVLLYDSNSASLPRALNTMRDYWLNKFGKDAATLCDRLRLTEKLEDLQEVDFLVEAIVEDFAIKSQIFKQLDAIISPNVIFVTNTSTISISELAKSLRRKELFMGMHFMNPPHILTLLELIKGSETSQDTLITVVEIARLLMRQPLLFIRDIPGFAVNGMVMPTINEAGLLVERLREAGMSFEIACERVDGSFECRVPTGGDPMGALRLADLIGIDTVVAGLREMAIANEHYAPCKVLTELVAQGRLGRKTRRGFFEYGSRN